MSRVGKKPITLPKGVECKTVGQQITVKGPKGSLDVPVLPGVTVSIGSNAVQLQANMQDTMSLGTTRALLNNVITGVSEGYQKKLELQGVGYRAAMQGKDLNLTIGFSHPVLFQAPAGITIETPTQTEVLIKGIDKQQVGEAAAKIRAFRPPEPYKGKGIRYSGEKIILKEVKKA